MTEIDKALVQEIKNDTELSNLLQDGTSFRLYPVAVPEEVDPDKCIIYSDSTSNTYPNAETSMYDFQCIATKYSDSIDLADKVKILFNDKRNNDLGGIKTVTYTKFENKTTFYDNKGKKYITVVEVLIKY